MVKGVKVGHRSNSRKRGRSKDDDSDGSDEDYVVSDEGNEESEEDAEEYCSSLDECVSEEGFGFFLEDEEEKVVRKAVRLKAKRMPPARKRKPRKQKSVSDEEDDEDYEVDEEDDEEEYKVEEEEYEVEDEEEEDEEEGYDDDEEDNEFTLDEEDCFDEEEELTVTKKKNSTKVRKQGLRKKRKKSVVSNKPSSKGERTKRRLKRKRRVEEEDEDCDFIDNNPIVRKKSRTNGGRRNKAYVVPSGSDFVSSGASDYEYTISEEERKQVKEASQLCGSLKTSLRSSSSSKIIEEVEELGQHKKSLGRKGKEKVEEKKAEVIKPVCGICLSEEDKRRFRGTLNCCSHYFCFTCIMAWSKVESRCPLCKQRFETISKPTRSTAGVDLREVVIQVPKRDQVYQPSEEELRSYMDPYENVFCSECHQGGDDELMLLCDLCDSSAHTYCVGLGREVPEGNWYCDGCRPVALGPSSPRVQDFLPDQRTNNLYNRFSPIVNVGESLDSNVVPSPSPRMPLTPGFVGLSSPRFPSADTAGSPVSGAGAPTLTGRRWLHCQIQNLRSINRMNLMAGRDNGISAANMDIDFVNSHIDQSREPTVQQARTQDVGTQPQLLFEERLQDYPSSSLQNRDLFASRLGHLSRQAVQDSTIPLLSTPANFTLWPELAGMSSNEQLRPCSNGSNIRSDGQDLPFSVRVEDNVLMAREQLHAIVRSHLKAFSNGIDLDNGTLKDIATSSMHTLLAACGLEHRRSEVQIMPPSSNCVHIERVAAGQASLMKGCCLTCFDSFVKDVVKRIMDTRTCRWLSLGL